MSAASSTKLHPSSKVWSEQIFAPQPTQPWRKDHKKGGGTIFQDAESHAVRKATPYLIPKEKLANCGEMQKASVCGVLEFKPRLRGSSGKGPKPAEACCPKARGHEAKSLTSTGMLPQFQQKEGWSTLGLKQYHRANSPPPRHAVRPQQQEVSLKGLERR